MNDLPFKVESTYVPKYFTVVVNDFIIAKPT